MADNVYMMPEFEEFEYENDGTQYTQVDPYRYTIGGSNDTHWGRIPSDNQVRANYIVNAPDVESDVDYREDRNLPVPQISYEGPGTKLGAPVNPRDPQQYLTNMSAPRSLVGSEIRRMDPITRLAHNAYAYNTTRVPVPGEDYNPADPFYKDFIPTRMDQLQEGDGRKYDVAKEFGHQIQRYVHNDQQRQEDYAAALEQLQAEYGLVSNLTTPELPTGVVVNPPPVIGDPVLPPTVQPMPESPLPGSPGGNIPTEVLGDPVLAQVIDSMNG